MRERVVPGAAAKDERGSTQPDMLWARIRRQVPLVSPSWTRESGPMEATIRESLLGAARTMTHAFETEVTQRAEVFGAGGGVAGAFADKSLVDGKATVRDDGAGIGADTGVTSPADTVGGETFGTADPGEVSAATLAAAALFRMPLDV